MFQEREARERILGQNVDGFKEMNAWNTEVTN